MYGYIQGGTGREAYRGYVHPGRYGREAYREIHTLYPPWDTTMVHTLYHPGYTTMVERHNEARLIPPELRKRDNEARSITFFGRNGHNEAQTASLLPPVSLLDAPFVRR